MQFFFWKNCKNRHIVGGDRYPNFRWPPAASSLRCYIRILLRLCQVRFYP